MKIKINRINLLYLAVVIITVSNCQYFINKGIDNYISYVGYAIILYDIIKHFHIKKNKGRVLEFIIVSILFSVGILAQTMDKGTKLTLVISMLLISMIGLLSVGLIRSFDELRHISNSILVGIFIALIISIVTGTEVVSTIEEGIVPYGFTGGLGHKNNFGLNLLGAFTGIYLYYHFEKKKKTDGLILLLTLLLIIASHARVAWLLLALFFLFMQGDAILKKLKKYYKILVPLLGFFIIGIFAFVMHYLNTHSSTVAIRNAGLTNWLNYTKGDTFHLLFGNAALAWANTGLGYVLNVRSVVGWDGTLEMGFLGILIKNGIIGLIGYIIMFASYYIRANHLVKKNFRIIAYTIISLSVFSLFTESFMINTIVIYGTFNYLMINVFTDDQFELYPRRVPKRNYNAGMMKRYKHTRGVIGNA